MQIYFLQPVLIIFTINSERDCIWMIYLFIKPIFFSVFDNICVCVSADPNSRGLEHGFV